MKKDEILTWLKNKENRKLFLKKCLHLWHWAFIHTQAGTTGWQATIKKEYCTKNQRHGDELLIFGMVLQSWPEWNKFPIHTYSSSDLLDLLEELKRRYSDRLRERATKFPHRIKKYPAHWYIHEYLHRNGKDTKVLKRILLGEISLFLE